MECLIPKVPHQKSGMVSYFINLPSQVLLEGLTMQSQHIDERERRIEHIHFSVVEESVVSDEREDHFEAKLIRKVCMAVSENLLLHRRQRAKRRRS